MPVMVDDIVQANGGNFATKMDGAGITDEALIEHLKAKLQAKELRCFNDKGSVIYSDPLETHDIQIKALEMALRLKGKFVEHSRVQIDGAVPVRPLSEAEEAELEAVKAMLKKRNG